MLLATACSSSSCLVLYCESSVDYSISEVLTQMERGAPVLERATAAVVVKDPNFTTEREKRTDKVRGDLRVLLRESADLFHDCVFLDIDICKRLTNLDYTIDTVPADTNPVPGAADYTLLIIIGSGVAVLLILLIVFLVLLIRRRKKRKKDAEAQALIDEAEEQRQQMEKEIAEHKLALQAEALANVNVKEGEALHLGDFEREHLDLVLAEILINVRGTLCAE